jgi:hypothetical protein
MASMLSSDPAVMGIPTAILGGLRALMLVSSTVFTDFQQIYGGSGPIFTFEVGPDGLIDYDPANEEFLDGRGTTTLNVRGFTITLTGGRFPTTFCQWKLGRAICPGTARTS